LSHGICISEILDWGIGILFLVMLDEVSGDIGIRLDEEEEYQHRHCRGDPGVFWTLMPVGEMRVEMVGKEEPGLHDEGLIPPVEEAVVEGEEPGKHALIEPDKGGVIFSDPPLSSIDF